MCKINVKNYAGLQYIETYSKEPWKIVSLSIIPMKNVFKFGVSIAVRSDDNPEFYSVYLQCESSNNPKSYTKEIAVGDCPTERDANEYAEYISLKMNNIPIIKT